MSNNKNSFRNPFLLLFIFTLGIYLGKYLAKPTQLIRLDTAFHYPKLVELLSYLEHNYVEAVNLDSLQEEVLTHTLESLDPHSSYISLEELKDVTENMQGNFEGIGVQFQIIEDTIVVISPISGGPSERMGIRAGDKIVKVDTLNVAGVGFTNKDVLSTLKGAKGTQVKLFIQRKNIHRLLEFDIIRDEIPITSVDVSYLIDDEIGYIKVNRFSGTTDEEFITALDRLKNEGMEKLILDLRSNPGGYLHAAITMVDEFLSGGKLIVYTQGNSRPKTIYNSTSYGGFKKRDIVVLVDEGSASASEIVAGAIQDHDRGIVIGRRTFGKGLVQEQSQLSDGSAFRLTTSRYYTPSGRCIQKPYNNGSDAYHEETMSRYLNGELYAQDSVKVEDSLKFYTNEGRIVYGGGGIYPDYFVPIDTVGRSDWLYDIFASNLISTFVFENISEYQNEIKRFKSAQEFQDQFHVSEAMFNRFVKHTEKSGVSNTIQQIQHSKSWIKMRIKAQIAKHEWKEEGFFRAINHSDPMLQKAFEVLYSK